MFDTLTTFEVVMLIWFVSIVALLLFFKMRPKVSAEEQQLDDEEQMEYFKDRL